MGNGSGRKPLGLSVQKLVVILKISKHLNLYCTLVHTWTSLKSHQSSMLSFRLKMSNWHQSVRARVEVCVGRFGSTCSCTGFKKYRPLFLFDDGLDREGKGMEIMRKALMKKCLLEAKFVLMNAH